MSLKNDQVQPGGYVHTHIHQQQFKQRNASVWKSLTLRGILKWTCVVTGGTELVDHPGDVLHLLVHHGLYIVHVEQVEPLQTAVKGRDLAPGIAQAGRHPVQLHLGAHKEEIILVHGIQSRCTCGVNRLFHYSVSQVEFWDRSTPRLSRQNGSRRHQKIIKNC